MRFVAVVVASMLAATSVIGQEGRALRLLVSFESSLPGADSTRYADALVSALSRSPFFGEIRQARSSDGLAEAAGRLDCDAALEAGLSHQSDGELLFWRLYSASGGYLIGEDAVPVRLPDARSLQELFWLPLIASVESMIAGVDSRRSVRLFVVGPPGAVVGGIDTAPRVLPDDGVAEFSVVAPRTIAWSAEAEGYDRASGLLSVFEQKPLVLHLPLHKQYRWTIDLGMYNGTFLDLGVSRRLADDRFFLRAGLRQFFVGLSLLDQRPGFNPPLFASLPLIQTGVGGGALFGKPGDEVRTYAGALLTTRIAMPDGAGVFIDPIAPLCLEPFAGIEWRPMRRCGFFGELDASIYLFADTRLFAATIKEGEGPSALLVYWPGMVLSIPDLRFGARFYL